MSPRPSVFPRLPLGECTEFVLDGTHGSPARTPSGIPVLSAANVKDGRLSYETERYTTEQEYETYRRRLDVRQGDVLLTIVGTIGRTAVVHEVYPHIFQRSVAVLRPRRALMDSRYLFHALNTAETTRQLASRTNQSAQGGVYLGALKEISVPAPPLSEQRRIADILDKADTIRRKRKEAITLTEELLRSAFLEMFGDPVTNPKGWPVKQLSDVVREGTIVTYGIVQAGPHVDGGIPYIRTGDIKDNRIIVDGLQRTSPEIASRFRRSEVRTGDLVMSIRATVGTVAVVPPHLDGANLTQGTARIAPGQDVTREFLFEHIRAPGMQRWLQERVKGATFKEITLGELRTAPIMLPPRPLQQRFTEFSTRVQKVIKKQEQARCHAIVLFAALVDRAFDSRPRSGEEAC